MAEYPEAEFFKEFFRRTKHNLECIEQQNDAYSVTQLINSLFGMLIFPQQKYCKDIRIIDGKKRAQNGIRHGNHSKTRQRATTISNI